MNIWFDVQLTRCWRLCLFIEVGRIFFVQTFLWHFRLQIEFSFFFSLNGFGSEIEFFMSFTNFEWHEKDDGKFSSTLPRSRKKSRKTFQTLFFDKCLKNPKWKINLIYLQFSLFFFLFSSILFSFESWRLSGWNSKLKNRRKRFKIIYFFVQ